MAKSKFGPIGDPTIRGSYTGDVVLAAGVAVVGGAAYNSVALPGGANVRALGVTAQATANIGDPVAIVELGEVTAVADAAIARGDYVMVNAATGKLAPVGAVAGTNYHAVGIALEAAAAQNDEFLLLVLPQRVQG
jgi:hypothetical protein